MSATTPKTLMGVRPAVVVGNNNILMKKAGEYVTKKAGEYWDVAWKAITDHWEGKDNKPKEGGGATAHSEGGAGGAAHSEGGTGGAANATTSPTITVSPTFIMPQPPPQPKQEDTGGNKPKAAQPTQKQPSENAAHFRITDAECEVKISLPSAKDTKELTLQLVDKCGQLKNGGKTPETKTPETKTPETKTPETKTPETKTPETKTPETKTPETKTPETKTPETKTPETKTPETKTPEAKNGAKSPPSAPAPGGGGSAPRQSQPQGAAKPPPAVPPPKGSDARTQPTKKEAAATPAARTTP